MIEQCCKLFLCFVIFSFLGWIMETLLYIFRDGKVVKRGFLFGPICPIYGVGALIALLLIKSNITNSFWIFYIGLILCGILEYITHFIMEKAFKAMWWDYSDRMLNINGRVYLKGLIFFGIGMLLLVKLILPPVVFLLELMPEWALMIFTFIMYTIILIDITTTIADLLGTVKLLKRAINNTISKSQEGVDEVAELLDVINAKREESVDKTKDKLKEITLLNMLIRNIKREHKTLERIKNKYPNFNIKNYKEELEWYFGPEKDKKGKDGIKLHGDGDMDIENKTE